MEKLNSKIKLSNNSSFVILIGWVTKLGMIRCRKTDILEFQNNEY